MAALMGKTKTAAAVEKLEGQSSAQVPPPRSHRIFAARIPRPRSEDIDAEIPVARTRKEGVLN